MRERQGEAVAKRLASVAALVVFVLPLLAFPGCKVKKTTKVAPENVLSLQTATLEELLERVRAFSAVRSLNATTELEPATGSAYTGVIEEYHDVRAFLLARRSSGRQIRLLGQAPVLRKTIFDMTADDNGFRILLPTKNKFIVGPARLRKRSAKPIENLRPQHLFDAVLPEPPWPDTPHVPEENEVEGKRYYAVSEMVRGEGGALELARKWWFERSGLTLERAQRFGTGGALESDVRYADWQDADGIAFPRVIELSRPQEDYRLRFLIQKLELNGELGPERFHLERPDSAEVVELKDESGEPNEPR
jgi:hypothetical protein